jgi:hypothetical protein
MPMGGFATIGLPAVGTQLQFGAGNSPETFTSVANISKIGGPTMQGTVVDVTSMSVTNAFRQKLVTLLEGGDVSFDLYWIPMLANHQAMLGFFLQRGQGGVAGVPIDWRMVFPDQDGTTYTFSGFISKMNFDLEVAGVVKAACVLTITGAVGFPVI